MNARRLMWVIMIVASAVNAKDTSPEVEKAIREGAKVRMTFHVRDSQGQAVSNAQFTAALRFWTKDDADIVEGVTDTNGMYTVEGITSLGINYTFTKDGYYITRHEKTFPNPQYTPNIVKDGKWQPWNPMIEITLKEKRNPVSMYVRRIDTQIPKNERIEFDCEEGDWVKPHGKGETGDFSVYYESSAQGWFDLGDKTIRLIISSEEDEGFIEMEKDTYSFAQTVYEAPKEGYDPEIVWSLERQDGKKITEINLPENHYLVFRSRVKKDEEGNIIHSRFGKIMGIKYGENRLTKEGYGYINFLYYFNSTDNDHNLEYDCVNNLINPRERINAP